MHMVEPKPWYADASHDDGELGEFSGGCSDLQAMMQRPAGEPRLRPMADLGDSAQIEAALEPLDRGGLVLTSMERSALNVDPHQPIGEDLEDLGNLVDLMALAA